MKRELLFKKIKNWGVTALLFLASIPFLQAQDTSIRLTQVDPSGDTVTISNFGATSADVTNYWLCLGPGTYVRVGATTGGNVVIPVNSDVRIVYDLNPTSGGVSLFNGNRFTSSDPDDLVSYMQYGSGNQARVNQAVTAGRWDSATAFVSGTAPYSTVIGGSADQWAKACDAFGGAIQIAGTTETTVAICVGEGVADGIEVEFDETVTRTGESFTWVITDQATNDILGAPAMMPAGGFVLEDAGPGVCDIWYLRYTGDIGLTTAKNVSDLTGCFDLSNPISVTRNAVNGGQIQIAGTTDVTAEICVGEGTPDPIEVAFVADIPRYGESFTWVITDQATNDILGAPAMMPAGGFVLEDAGPGVCDIWYLRYTGDIGLATAKNVSDLTGCFDLSNPISVTRNAVNGGQIQIAGTTDVTAEICVGEGTPNPIEVAFVADVPRYGESFTWVITDQATNDILGAPAMMPAGGFVLEGAGPGVCDIWYLRYTGDIGLATAKNVSDLTGCFDLSNPISVTRNAVNGGQIQIAGTTDVTAEICVGEGTPDPIEVAFVADAPRYGESFTWVITDQATNDILGAPAMMPAGGFVLEGAGPGVCDIWYLRYTGDIGLATAKNVSDLTGCFDLSNPISVTRLTGSDCNVLSVDDFDEGFNFAVYPNPTKNSVTIKFKGNQNLDLDVMVIDMLGKQIISKTLSTSRNMTIDLSSLTIGTYFLNILDKNSGATITKHVIKN